MRRAYVRPVSGGVSTCGCGRGGLVELGLRPSTSSPVPKSGPEKGDTAQLRALSARPLQGPSRPRALQHTAPAPPGPFQTPLQPLHGPGRPHPSRPPSNPSWALQAPFHPLLALPTPRPAPPGALSNPSRALPDPAPGPPGPFQTPLQPCKLFQASRLSKATRRHVSISAPGSVAAPVEIVAPATWLDSSNSGQPSALHELPGAAKRQ